MYHRSVTPRKRNKKITFAFIAPTIHKIYDTLPEKKYFQAPFLVLQLVTNRGLMSVLGRTKWYLVGPQYEYRGPVWSFQVLFGPSRYSLESSICDKLKHQKRCLGVLFS